MNQSFPILENLSYDSDDACPDIDQKILNSCKFSKFSIYFFPIPSKFSFTFPD